MIQIDKLYPKLYEVRKLNKIVVPFLADYKFVGYSFLLNIYNFLTHWLSLLIVETEWYMLTCHYWSKQTDDV